jgi:murein tripeptide amidase MpaA
LTDDLTNIIKQKHDFITRNTLCRTLAGNKCEYLTITSKKHSDPALNKKKKGVILSSRIHPGESNASWMMKGIIDFLVSDNVEAELLRNNFIFKIIPMLNPDGVISGNYRCSLAGCDLNRRWKHPSEVLHPTIYYTK